MPSDDYEPSEADLDLVIEEVSGKPAPPANLNEGISSLQQRIAHLEAEKAKLLDRMGPVSDATLKDHLATLNKDLASARERLAHYQAQLDRRN